MIARIFAITIIFVCTSLAWIILGKTVDVRTNTQGTSLHNEVRNLWGVPQQQKAPQVYVLDKKINEVKLPGTHSSTSGRDSVASGVGIQKTDSSGYQTGVTSVREWQMIDASDIKVDLHLDYRQKGLLWYSTYKVLFYGKYRVVNTFNTPRTIVFEFPFPNSQAIFDNFRFKIGSREVKDAIIEGGMLTGSTELDPGASEVFEVGYESNGLDNWWYLFGDNVNTIHNFSLVASTNFDAVDFPAHAISPTAKEQTGSGWKLSWQYRSLLTGVQIGVAMPEKLNPGPWVSQVTYFAPVCLFLFFFMLMVFSVVKQVPLHPMHYFFIGGSFFSFHLLLAYLVDHISIHSAFALSSVVSIALVVSYMRIVVGRRYAFVEIAFAQFVFLILFSYSFFFTGYTGLTITIACIATLFIVMQATAKLKWEEIFAFRTPTYRDLRYAYSPEQTAMNTTENKPGESAEKQAPWSESDEPL